MITLLVTPEEFEEEKIQVGGESYRHLFRARRTAVGERLRLVDGAGRARWAEVAAVDRSIAHLRSGEPAPSNESPLYLELFCAMPKPERASWLVEKVTEVGVVAVRFVASERAPRELGGGAMSRLRRIAVSAVEQCHRSRLPEISGVHAWSSLGEMTAAHELRVALAAGGGGEVARPSSVAGRVALLVGPEGGWTPAELADLDSQGWLRHRLGARTLRTETAAIAGAAWLLQGKD